MASTRILCDVEAAARSVVASELTDEFDQFSRTSGRVNGDRQCVLSIFHLVPE